MTSLMVLHLLDDGLWSFCVLSNGPHIINVINMMIYAALK